MTRLAAALVIMATQATADAHTFKTSDLSLMTATQTDENGCMMVIDIYNDEDPHRRMLGILGVDGVGVDRFVTQATQS